MIVGISGSLRRASVNSAALRAIEAASHRHGFELRIDDHPGRLPLFDPDREGDVPPVVADFRAGLADASAVLIAVPEYAFGIPGAFKNALDWTVGSGSLDAKRVAALSVAPTGRGAEVRHALGRVLTAVGARFTCHHVPVVRSDRDERGEPSNPGVIERLVAVAVVLDRDAQVTLRSS